MQIHTFMDNNINRQVISFKWENDKKQKKKNCQQKSVCFKI